MARKKCLEQLAYWKEQLNVPPVIESLPTRPAPSDSDVWGSEQPIVIPTPSRAEEAQSGHGDEVKTSHDDHGSLCRLYCSLYRVG